MTSKLPSRVSHEGSWPIWVSLKTSVVPFAAATRAGMRTGKSRSGRSTSRARAWLAMAP